MIVFINHLTALVNALMPLLSAVLAIWALVQARINTIYGKRTSNDMTAVKADIQETKATATAASATASAAMSTATAAAIAVPAPATVVQSSLPPGA